MRPPDPRPPVAALISSRTGFGISTARQIYVPGTTVQLVDIPGVIYAVSRNKSARCILDPGNWKILGVYVQDQRRFAMPISAARRILLLLLAVALQGERTTYSNSSEEYIVSRGKSKRAVNCR